MGGPWSFGWRSLRRRPLRAALTVTGIAIGVALVFAVLSVDAAASGGAAGYARELAGRADMVVQAFGEGTLAPASLATIADTPGVLATSSQVRRPTFATGPRGTLGPVTVVGVDPAADRALHDETVVAGAPLAQDGAGTALLTSSWARAHDVGVGSRLSLVGGGGERSFLVVGLLADSGPALADSGRLVYVTLGAARSLFGLPAGAADRVEVRVDPAVGVAELETRLEDRLTSGPYVISTTADQAASLSGATRDISSGLLLVAAVVLFVGALLVSDALALSVEERTREVGLLRSVGATRGQVNRMVLEEAAWLGIGGAVLGVGAGALLAVALGALVAPLTGAPLDPWMLDPGALGVAILLGFLVTLGAALEPAWRAGRIPAVEALRRGPAAPAPRLRGLAGAGTVAALVGMVLLELAGWNGSASPGGSSLGQAGPAGPIFTGVAGALGALILLAIGGLVAPLALRVAGALVALILAPLGRPVRAQLRLARGTLAHDPGRVAVTLAALTVGLALLVGLSGVADGMRRAGDAWVTDVAPADLAVVAITAVPTDFSADLAAVPGVASVTPVRLFEVAIAGRLASAMAVDPAAYQKLGALTVEGASRAAAFAALQAGGAALVPSSVADRFGLRPGDPLELQTALGRIQLRVAAIVAHSIPGAAGESVVMSSADASRALGITGASLFLVRAARGAGPALGPRLSGVASPYAMTVVQPTGIGGAVTGALDRTFGLLDLLAVAAVVVAALCIVNVLAMDVRRRVRELGLLRAAGLTRRQAWGSVVLEAGILGLAGALLGVGLGVVASAVVLVAGGTTDLRTALDVPAAAVVTALALGVAGAILASAYPAHVASRVEIVQALGGE
ncbi:MAG: FtsX-like permease family protein [Candidatus Limnocylindrales bacterium]